MTPASKRPPVTIPTPRGFVFQSAVVSHGWYRLAPFRWAGDEQVLYRTELLGRRPRELEIRFTGRELSVAGVPDSRELRRKIERMFQLHVDTSEFHAAARRSAAHAWVEDAGFGRLLCGSTLFEDVVKIITTTNVTWRQTVRMVELLVEVCGLRAKSGAAAFPDPEDIVGHTAEDLQLKCRLGYRAKSIHLLASSIVDGSLNLDAIADPSQTTAELFASYRRLPGIGPYGAAHLLAMDGRHDVIAVDSEFRRFVRETYHGGREVSDRTLLRRYARWGRWQYLAYWSELWRSVAERVASDE